MCIRDRHITEQQRGPHRPGRYRHPGPDRTPDEADISACLHGRKHRRGNLAYYRETPEAFVRRRHLELRQQGHSNSSIYAAIKREMDLRLFATEPHSERQIRRIIYG